MVKPQLEKKFIWAFLKITCENRVLKGILEGGTESVKMSQELGLSLSPLPKSHSQPSVTVDRTVLKYTI